MKLEPESIRMSVPAIVADGMSAVSVIMIRGGESVNETSGPSEKRAGGNFIRSSEVA